MEHKQISFQMKHRPKLDPGFIPFGLWMEAYLKNAAQPIAIAVVQYSHFYDLRHLMLPDEKPRRVGQSAAAASLPEV